MITELLLNIRHKISFEKFDEKKHRIVTTNCNKRMVYGALIPKVPTPSKTDCPHCFA